jgi:hypothetical protein
MEDIISMTPLSIKLLILLFGLLAIVIAAYYRIDGFDSDPNAGTKGCDSTCKGGGYSKKTGQPCCNTAAQPDYPESQKDCKGKTVFIKGTTKSDNYCGICTELDNGKTECINPGTYDTVKFRAGSINKKNAKTDVLDQAAKPTYLTDLREIRKRERILNKGNDAEGRDLYDNDFSFLDDDDGIITSKGSDLGKSQGVNVTGEVFGNDDDSGDIVTKVKKGKRSKWWKDSDAKKSKRKDKDFDPEDSAFDRKTVKQLLNDSSNKYDTIPGFDDEDISENPKGSWKKRYNRNFERPSEETYDKGAGKGYDSCNKYQSCNDTQVEEEEVCEGFSPLI